MEVSILNNFVNRTVEVLVAGVWIEGRLTPIQKGVVTILPVGLTKELYGPCAVKAESVQAIREVKLHNAPAQPVSQVPTNPAPPPPVQSGFAEAQGNHPGMKYVHK